MRITKEADIGTGAVLDATELGLIHALSRRELKAEEVYTFCVRLCDNEIDRDGERFPAETLGELARLFVGKSGMFDHQWSARGQTARIYRTELVRESGLTRAGDAYCYLKGYAYMLRSEKNRELIEEIEGGIKKEVSVSCAVERAVCSICGEEFRDREACAHVKGREYEGKLCWVDLVGATDAYEWSFVAVPAQPNAGVLKGFRQDARMEQLEREAALGRKYLEGLRFEVARLGGLARPELDSAVRKSIAGKLEEGELLALKRAYERVLEEKFPVKTQLTYDKAGQSGGAPDRAFLIFAGLGGSVPPGCGAAGPDREQWRIGGGALDWKGEKSMNKISFEGIGEVAATFACEAGVQEGQVVKLTGNGTVGACGDKERFCGVALVNNGGFASVQVSGLAEVGAGEDVSAGWVKLSADSKGGVQRDDAAGMEYLVVSAGGGRAVVRL